MISKEKCKNGKIPKASSSPGPTSPSLPSVPSFSLSDVDDRIAGHLTSWSESFDRKLEALTTALVDKLSSLAPTARSNVSDDRVSNRSFPAPPEVPVRQSFYRRDPSLRTPESIVGSHQEFQGEGMVRVPSSSHTPFPYAQGESPSVREFSGLGSESPQVPPDSEVGPAKTAKFRKTAWVSFNVPSSPSPVDLDDGEEEEAGRDSVVSTPQVQNKTLFRLINFINDQYPESCPLASPPLVPRCRFEDLYAISDPKRRLVRISGFFPG